MYVKEGSLAVIDLEQTSRVLVFGDIHGDLASLEAGISFRRPDDLLLFLGDYADRGERGIEVIEGIHALMARIPNKILALKGNHEDYDETGNPRFSPCTLMEEAEKKRGGWNTFFRTFTNFSERFCLSAIIPGYAFFAHGGVGSELASAEALIHPSWAAERQILWGDPIPEDGEYPSYRGAGNLFGPDISARVLQRLEVQRFFRSHEPQKAWDKPCIEHGGRVITTSATRIYGGRPYMLVLDREHLPLSQEDIIESVHYLDGPVW